MAKHDKKARKKLTKEMAEERLKKVAGGGGADWQFSQGGKIILPDGTQLETGTGHLSDHNFKSTPIK